MQAAENYQYVHLNELQRLASQNNEIKTALGSDYIGTDVVILQEPEPDAVINQNKVLVGKDVATRSALRARFQSDPVMHGCISCKWTMRSDRAQNTRTEALNLMRNRKGHTPHIVAVTAEPLPSRISSLALGTGDLDCVYHFALTELMGAVQQVGDGEAENLLNVMVEGKRLKDISDLPLDLAV